MISRKKASTIVVTIFWLIVAFVTMLAVRTFAQVIRIDDLEHELNALREANRQVVRSNETLDITLATTVLNEFVPLFINVDLRNQYENDERMEQLNYFVSFDIRNINLGIDRNEQRILEEFEIISMREYTNFNIAMYRISYQIVTEIDGYYYERIEDYYYQQDEDGEYQRIENYEYQRIENVEEMVLSEVSLVLHIPFVMQEGLMSIVSMPYFTAEMPSLAHTTPFEQMNENDTSEEMRIARGSIEEFLPTFFEMYAGSDEQRLEMFMADVVLMGGNFELERVNTFGARYDFVGDNVLIQVSVLFRDYNTSFIHEVPFTLLLQQQANSWFVLEMQHLFIR